MSNFPTARSVWLENKLIRKIEDFIIPQFIGVNERQKEKKMKIKKLIDAKT